MVNLTNAPGFEGAEVSHPRWTNHPRFLTITGPYNQGGANQSRTGGKQTEVYVGRFSADFSKVEAWARVTSNSWGDSHPDVWIDVARSPHPRRPSGADRTRDRGGQRRGGRGRGASESRAPRGQRAPDAAGRDPDAEGDSSLPARAGRQRVRNRGGRAGHLCGARDSHRPVGDPRRPRARSGAQERRRRRSR